uniref:PX domain-containing protein n=1 Tax=Rhizophora mucronata TaxID=61149 RepID=A0A2P2NYS1_RHIMU
MYGCGSDDENRRNSCVQRTVDSSKQAKVRDENPLLINSSVAFGSDDWNDFEKEAWGGDLGSNTLFEIQGQKELDLAPFTSSSAASIGLSISVQTEVGGDVTGESEGIGLVEPSALVENVNICSAVSANYENCELEQLEETRGTSVASCQAQGVPELARDDDGASITPYSMLCEVNEGDARDISVCHEHVGGTNNTGENSKYLSLNDGPHILQDQLAVNTHINFGSNTIDCHLERDRSCAESQEFIHQNGRRALENGETDSSKEKLDAFCDTTSQLSCHPTECSVSASEEFSEEHKPNLTPLMVENDVSRRSQGIPTSMDIVEHHPDLLKAGNTEHNGFYDEIVNEMEEILLDSGESPGTRLANVSQLFQSQLSVPLRDGGSTASTSGAEDAHPLTMQPQRIDRVEVVGAKQKRGEVSLSERLVGVKEYTLYVIEVWSGQDQWEVERRYRDFFTLYRQLKAVFAEHGWTLPPPWSSVERESRKLFGSASPDVVSERSLLIQECLHSLLHSDFYSSLPSALLWFLCPHNSFPSSPAPKNLVPSTIFSNRWADAGSASNLGKTISLIVEVRPCKSLKQILEAQHYTCAGCHKHFNGRTTVMGDLVQTLWRGRPRLCEYTGQLFCSSCHTNETAVLPARVLHYWDFTQYPVSQLAKSYLESIHEQPMLCVSAVNPFLFSKVPALHHVMAVRKRIGTMVPYVRCPFCRTINKGLGYRRYLLESNDFFALRDLVDLSKGPFAALPVMVESVSRKILEHITEQCLICCDLGIPCSARQACNDPSSLIFPFQEGEIEKCPSCGSVFHKPCFRKLKSCSCGMYMGPDDPMEATNKLSRKASDYLLGKRSSPSVLTGGLLSGLFSSRAKSEKNADNGESDTVILMGSLPSTSL